VTEECKQSTLTTSHPQICHCRSKNSKPSSSTA